MKILTNENNEPKIYVQMKDILYLKKNDIKMPDSLIEKMLFDEATITNNNSLSYIGFIGESEIDFFNNQDYIIDLNEYKNLSLQEIEDRAKQLIELTNKIVIKYNHLSAENRKTNKYMKEMYNHLLYKLDSIASIYKLKRKDTKSLFMKPDRVKMLKK